ncbi:MAG: chemotaxis protein CheW, partial [Acidobacteriota bacterium]
FADRLDDGRRRSEYEARPVKLGTFVAFDLAGETYAMPVEPVRQVVRVSTITRVPHAPRPIRGVTNLRGRVIPVIDLRLRIGLQETQVGRASRVVSVSSRGRLIGLLVDAVHQVVHLDLYKVQPPPDDVMTLQSDYIEGVYGEGEDLILLLDIDKALIIREAGAA